MNEISVRSLRNLSLLLYLSTTAAHAQQKPPALKLKPANARLTAEFSGLSMIRELADGRVIILDSTEKKLFVGDFQTRASVPLGRTGDGPQEYRSPMGIFPLHGDSTLVSDATNRRRILAAGDRLVVTIPPPAEGTIAADGFVRGADAAGRIVMQFLPRGLGREIDQGDSIYLARFARTGGHIDTVGRLRSGFGGPPGSASKSTPQSELEYVPTTKREFMMAPVIGDQSAVFPDGWIALARMDPYRVDWVEPSGRVRHGAPLPVPVSVLNNREKRFYLDRLAKKDGKPAGDPGDIKNWLPAIPPFWGYYDTSLFPAPGGVLVIARAPTAALPNPTYDIVDRTGAYRGQLTLQPHQRIIGFGMRSVYVAMVDDDGIEHLQRHPWR